MGKKYRQNKRRTNPIVNYQNTNKKPKKSDEKYVKFNTETYQIPMNMDSTCVTQTVIECDENINKCVTETLNNDENVTLDNNKKFVITENYIDTLSNINNDANTEINKINNDTTKNEQYNYVSCTIF